MSEREPEASCSRVPDWDERLASFRAAPAELVARRELRRRVDIKYVIPTAAALDLLGALQPDYVILRAGIANLATYRTTYFDTAGLDFYRAHVHGRRLRQKVRVRHYPDRSVTFLEIKMRKSEMETKKLRRARAFLSNELSADDQSFVQLHTDATGSVAPRARTEFRRVTLINEHENERVTLDRDLRLEMGSHHRTLQDLAIVELKQWPRCRETPVQTALRSAGFRPAWASKYCAAIALNQLGGRHNRLLPGLRKLAGGAA